jgi:chromosome segregation and condensation protein ScpB
MGHAYRDVIRMTPKRIEAMLFVARKRVNAQRLEELVNMQMANTSDKDAVNKYAKALQQ